MKRWITEERVIELERMGKLRDNVTKAREWNGHKDTNGLGNVEFVTSTNAGAPTRKDGGPIAFCGQSTPAPLTLPWPPSGNTAVRHAKGVHYLRPEVTTYRQAIAAILGRSEPVVGRYELVIELSPPDARRRDIDNALKSLLDACVKCGWLPDDSMAYMRRLTVTVKDDRRGEVSIYALTDREAA